MTNLFENINEKNKEKLLKIIEANTLYFKKNINIISLLKNDNIIGIVESGEIQIIRTDYNGNRTIIEEITENDIFGSMISILSSDEYDIITKEDTKIIIIDYDQIISFDDIKYNYYNEFIKNLLKIVTTKIREKNERIEILTKKSIRNKLLEYFRITSQKSGSKIIYLPFSYTELADYLAIDRSAMTRELKNLKDEGFIKTANKKITLLY